MKLIDGIDVNDSKVAIKLGGELYDFLRKKRILLNDIFEYSISWNSSEEHRVNFKKLPDHILIIPLVLNLAPIIWRVGIRVEIDCLESEFSHSMDDLYLSYRRLWKELSWSGKFFIKEEVKDLKKKYEERGGVALCSLGVDSINTLINNREQVKIILGIIGADVANVDKDGINKFKFKSIEVARQFNLMCSIGIASNFKDILNYRGLSILLPRWAEWWTNIQHGPLLSSFLLVIAYMYNFKKGFIASTHHIDYQTRCASRHDLEGVLKLSKISVVHDGYNYSRQEKIKNIALKWNDLVHVCWHDENFENCGKCEKCIRTVLGFMVNGDLDLINKFMDKNIDYHEIYNIVSATLEGSITDWGSAAYYEDIKKHLKSDEYYINKCGYSMLHIGILSILRNLDPYNAYFKYLDKYYKVNKSVFSKRLKYDVSC